MARAVLAGATRGQAHRVCQGCSAHGSVCTLEHGSVCARSTRANPLKRTLPGGMRMHARQHRVCPCTQFYRELLKAEVEGRQYTPPPPSAVARPPAGGRMSKPSSKGNMDEWNDWGDGGGREALPVSNKARGRAGGRGAPLRACAPLGRLPAVPARAPARQFPRTPACSPACPPACWLAHPHCARALRSPAAGRQRVHQGAAGGVGGGQGRVFPAHHGCECGGGRGGKSGGHADVGPLATALLPPLLQPRAVGLRSPASLPLTFAAQENARKSEALPPSQGGKYVGFGSTPAPRPGSGRPGDGGDYSTMLKQGIGSVRGRGGRGQGGAGTTRGERVG